MVVKKPKRTLPGPGGHKPDSSFLSWDPGVAGPSGGSRGDLPAASSFPGFGSGPRLPPGPASSTPMVSVVSSLVRKRSLGLPVRDTREATQGPPGCPVTVSHLQIVNVISAVVGLQKEPFLPLRCGFGTRLPLGTLSGPLQHSRQTRYVLPAPRGISPPALTPHSHRVLWCVRPGPVTVGLCLLSDTMGVGATVRPGHCGV